MAAALFVLLAFGGCAKSEGPEGAWISWLADLRAGRLQRAFEALSIDSQRELAVRERGLGLAAAPEQPAGFALFRARVAPPELGGVAPVPKDPSRLLKSVEVSGERARLFLQLDEGSEAPTEVAELRREQGRWRIVLRF